MAERKRIFTMNDPHSLRINRELAEEIGFEDSIVLLQIEYLVSISTNERDGHIWIYNSLTDWRNTHFPWWSTSTIGRILRRLADREYIVIGNYNHLKFDHTQWFRLNFEKLGELKSITIRNDYAQSVTQRRVKLIHREEQDDTSTCTDDTSKESNWHDNTIDYTETTPETTAEEEGNDSRRQEPPPSPIPESDPHESELSEAVRMYRDQLLGKGKTAKVGKQVVHVPPIVPASFVTLIDQSVTNLTAWQQALDIWKTGRDGTQSYSAGNVPGLVGRYAELVAAQAQPQLTLSGNSRTGGGGRRNEPAGFAGLRAYAERKGLFDG